MRTAERRSSMLRCICCIAALVLAAGPASEASAGDPQRPNILLLVAEDLSPRVGSFGDPLAHTPSIDALAAAGVRYSSAFTTAGVCAPSRAALVTGQHQISFGGQHMRASTGPLGVYYAQPAAGVRAFPELLRAQGYFTFTDSKLDYQFSGVVAGTGPFSIWDREGADFTAWRERVPGQPFFGLLNFLETHESGVMRPHGEPVSEIHASTQRMRRNRGLVAATITDPARVVLPPYYPDLPAVRADLARHYDNIRQMDAQVGRVLHALRKEGLEDSTIVIWTTDHGDGLPRAKRELYDSGIHVPLILSVPEALRAGVDATLPEAGAADARLVSFVDLAPAILELAGVERPPYLHGEPFYRVERDAIFASRDRIDEVVDRQRAIRETRFKYIRSWHPELPGGHALAYRDSLDMVRAWRAAYQAGTLNAAQRRWFEPVGAEQLYDLARDPNELVNLADDPRHAAVLNRLRGALEERLAAIGDTGELEERALMAEFLDDGRIPLTPVPAWSVVDGRLRLESDVDASIGYRPQGEAHWQLYSGPLPLPQVQLEAKAVRYGWQESGVVPIPPSAVLEQR